MLQIFKIQTENSSIFPVFSSILQYNSTKFEKKDNFIIFYNEYSSYIYFIYNSNDFNEFILSLIDIKPKIDNLIIQTLLLKNRFPFILNLLSDPANSSLISIEIFDVFNNKNIEKSKTNFTVPNFINNNSIDINSLYDNESNISMVAIVYSQRVQPQNANGLFGIILELSENFNIKKIIIGKNPFDFGENPNVRLNKAKNGDIMFLEVIYRKNSINYYLYCN